jgi:hypothetical protein
VLVDRFFEETLAGVGAHVFVVGGMGYAEDVPGSGCDTLDVNGSGYVLAAVADEYAYSGHL